ncbi:MAG TPA: adenylate kinase [Thermoanaerobaculia bacterium]|nr:adenylate kinase [Thermoanaerobaculia bacterium]
MGAAGDGRRVVFLGPPGSGKGTQAALLAEDLGVPAISTGDMLREAVANGSEIGRRVRKIMEAGELVGDELMADVVKERLGHADAGRGFLLDGFPRTAAQAETLRQILDGVSEDLDHVVFIDVPEEELVRRALLRQRADDRDDVVRERLRVYREKTQPLVEDYRAQGLLREIDGNREVDTVRRAILDALEVNG